MMTESVLIQKIYMMVQQCLIQFMVARKESRGQFLIQLKMAVPLSQEMLMIVLLVA